MPDERDDQQPERGAKTPKRITFDDFEIQSRDPSPSDRESRGGFLKKAIPRIKNLSGDLLGSTKSKLLGQHPPEESSSYSPPEPEPFNDSLLNEKDAALGAQYFSDEEQTLIRVRKLPKKAIDQQPTTPKLTPYEAILVKKAELEAKNKSAQPLPQVEEIAVDSIESILIEEPTAGADLSSEEFDADETTHEAILIEYDSSESITEFPQEGVETILDQDITDEQPANIAENRIPQKEEPPAFLPSSEPKIDASMKVYLDALRRFESTPRRAGEFRDPRKDFVLLLSELLDLLRDHCAAQSALFFWVNHKKQQLVLECASLDDFAFNHLIAERHYPIEHDAISKTAIRGEPQLIGTIPPQAEYDLIPYYSEAIGIRSFASMPVKFTDSLVAVLAIDSIEAEQFGPETLRLLTEYSGLISGLVKSYIESYDLLTSARTLTAAKKLYQIAGADISARPPREAARTGEYILRMLSEAAGELVEWDWFSTIAFDEAQRSWGIQHLQAKDSEGYIAPRTQIDLADSLVGKSLQTGSSLRVDALTRQSVRFSLLEDHEQAIGHSFLVIPIRTASKNYGALAIENSESGRFTDVDIETIEHLTRSAAAALEIFSLSEIVQERSLTDLLTGLLNKRGFDQRFAEELARAKEFNEALSLVLFEIDDVTQFKEQFHQEDLDTIVLSLSNVLQYLKQPYDALARIGEFRFAVLLSRTIDEEAYLWSEKVRQKIVSEVIALGRKSFSVTTSIGIIGARSNSTPEDLIMCSKLALEKAKERGGNEVIVY